jgi:hypothetical protein
MPKKRLGAEQIVTKLQQFEVPQSYGTSVTAAFWKTAAGDFV